MSRNTANLLEGEAKAARGQPFRNGVKIIPEVREIVHKCNANRRVSAALAAVAKVLRSARQTTKNDRLSHEE